MLARLSHDHTIAGACASCLVSRRTQNALRDGTTIKLIPFSPGDTGSMQEAVNTAKADNLHIFVVVLDASNSWDLLPMARAAGIMGEGYVWISVETDLRGFLTSSAAVQGMAESEVADMRAALQGCLIVKPTVCAGDCSASSGGGHGYSMLQDIFLSGYLPPSLPDVVRETIARMPSGYATKPPPIHAAYAYDAMWTVALGLAAGLEDGSIPAGGLADAGGEALRAARESLLSHMKAVDFEGASGRVSFDDGERSAETVQYSLERLTFEGEAWNSGVGSWVQHSIFKLADSGQMVGMQEVADSPHGVARGPAGRSQRWPNMQQGDPIQRGGEALHIQCGSLLPVHVELGVRGVGSRGVHRRGTHQCRGGGHQLTGGRASRGLPHGAHATGHRVHCSGRHSGRTAGSPGHGDRGDRSVSVGHSHAFGSTAGDRVHPAGVFR